jgi:CRISPR/Cas system-associated exonuclease Cas4 (RecB family)
MPYTYRMSHIGTCPRALSAERLGMKAESIPKWLESSANEGKWHEERIIEELQADDIAVTGRQMEVILHVDDNIHLLGHIDGIVNNHDDTKNLLEIKSMSQYEFDRWMRGGWQEFPQYATQLTCYMEALGIYRALYIVKNRNNGTIDTQTIIGTPEPMESIIEELKEIEQCVAKGKLFPGNFDPMNTNCKRCVYKEHCVEIPIANEQDIPRLKQAVDDYRSGKLLEQESKTLLDSAKSVFTEHTKAIIKDKWTFEHMVFAMTHVNRIDYDKKLLEEYLTPEQLEPCKKFVSYDFLKITDKG